MVDGWLNVPENAQALVGSGQPDEATHEGRSQKARLEAWVELLEREKLMEYVIASYETVPLLAEYSPRINAQQLKNALISREERERVEKLIEEHGKLSLQGLNSATARVAGCRGAERAKMAARFLRDFLRYHRDLRRLEALNSALDSGNLIGNWKLRELSAMNGTLYEFLLPEEQKPSEDKVLRHVILKADIRDSSRLTRSLLEQGMNPASYFSLNFYDPVNKLLAKYGARKVFVEGDAIIVALLEHEGEAPSRSAGLACWRARLSTSCAATTIFWSAPDCRHWSWAPAFRFRIQRLCTCWTANRQIMISDALNESDRLSSCSKRVRKAIAGVEGPFNVYAFQTVKDADAGESPEDFILKYNLNGIRLSEAAFQRLQQEISLEPCQLELPRLWGSEVFQLHRGLVPVGNEIFKKILVRTSRIAQIDPHKFSLQHWTERPYYEVCTNPAIYAMLEGKTAKGGF